MSRAATFSLVIAGAGSSGVLGQTFDLKQLDVEKGALEFELSNTTQSGLPQLPGAEANRSSHEVAVHYSPLDWWRLSGTLAIDNPAGSDPRLSSAAIESILVFKKPPENARHGSGFGWFTAVEAATHSDSTNAVVFGPIFGLTADRWAITANPFFEKTFGRNREDGIAFDYRWQVKYELTKHLAAAVEGYGTIDDLGNSPSWSEQEHRVGPVLVTELEIGSTHLHADVGVLFGLTPATPDVAVKLNVGVPLGKAGGMK